jgi:hypothetical protein
MLIRVLFEKYCCLGLTLFVLCQAPLFAGNPDRGGQSGASELLINPWARSSGWGNANSASIRGLEAVFLNIAGTAFTKKTELIFCRSNWLQGTGIHLNTFGFSQKMGKQGALTFAVMSQNFGDIQVTTTDQPEGGLGTYSPAFTNFSLGYARAFSKNIYGGANVKLITESLANIAATGFAFDGGIQYVTGFGKNADGSKDTSNFKFGISMKNWGPDMRYSGDGLSFRSTSPPKGGSYTLTVAQRSDKFELPLLITIGAAYDYKISQQHKLTGAISFVSNSFSKDQYNYGLEYGYKSCLMLRTGFSYENGIFNIDTRSTVLTGPSAGFTIEIPFNNSKRTFGLDYSYRHTQPFQGVHSLGARINL